MKKLSVFLVLVLLLSLFAGCKQEPTSTTAAPEPPQSAATTTAPVATEAVTTAAPVTTEAAATEAPTQAPAETYSPEELAAVHPMLFHVTGENGREMYLFGTIHVADKRVDVALSKLAPILDGCDALAVEFDLVAFEQDLEAQMKSQVQFLYSDGSTIEDHMPQELYQRASALLEEAGLSPMVTRIFNLSMWSTLVEQAALMTRTDFDMEVGMDRSLIHYCYDRKIPVRNVESPELQYNMMAGFSDMCICLTIGMTTAEAVPPNIQPNIMLMIGPKSKTNHPTSQTATADSTKFKAVSFKAPPNESFKALNLNCVPLSNRMVTKVMPENKLPALPKLSGESQWKTGPMSRPMIMRNSTSGMRLRLKISLNRCAVKMSRPMMAMVNPI